MHVYTCIIRFMHDTAKRSAIQGLSQKRSVRAVVFDYGNVLCLEQTLEDMKGMRSEEHTSELQSHLNLVCRLLLEKKKQHISTSHITTNNHSQPQHYSIRRHTDPFLQ